MRSTNPFPLGRMICRHITNPNIAVLFDGHTTVHAIIGTLPPKVGQWYTVYYENGQFYLGSEVDARV